MPEKDQTTEEKKVKRPEETLEAFHLLAKPTGALCNLACDYCFFLEKKELYPGSRLRMTDEVLEKYMRQLIEAHRIDNVAVSWQGGEPTLMGLEFYQKVMALEAKYGRPGMTFMNTLQTNGTLLDDTWCEFFKENGFLIGISIDGPRQLHDIYRRDKGGKPTFDKVMRGLRLLQKHGVDFNVLTTVNSANADHPLEVYRFLRDEVGTDWIQLIPVVERIDPAGRRLYQEGGSVTDRSVRPEQFGDFLCGIFDEWLGNDVGRVFVQTFEAALRCWTGMPPGMCVFEETCGRGPALEHNGDIYSCDHFVVPDRLIGNIMEQPMSALVAAEEQRRFGRDKLDTLPQYCRDCDVLFACHGECPKNRFVETPTGEAGLNYLCAGFKQFLHHIDYPARIIAGLVRSGQPADGATRILADQEDRWRELFARTGRNDSCPCGSGLKFKRCHAQPGAASPRKPAPDA
jgi:uncharacterized protein